VLDKDGNFVAGLPQTKFHVFDKGVEQPIQFFSPVEVPAQVLVVLETSPAVYLISNQHLAAAYALVEGLAPDDQVALVTYNETPRTALSFTSDKSALLAALGKIQYNLGMANLNFYDSVSAVLDWLAPLTGKREIVLLTTGLDSSPPSRWDALVNKLRGEDVVIFSVALGGPLRIQSKKKTNRKKATASPAGDEKSGVEAGLAKSEEAFAEADQALRSLAAITGGRAYFPQSDGDFAPMYRQIASALRHEYVLGIAPAEDNQFHALTVEVDSNGQQPDRSHSKRPTYRVFARSGYLAPGP